MIDEHKRLLTKAKGGLDEAIDGADLNAGVVDAFGGDAALPRERRPSSNVTNKGRECHPGREA